MDNKLNLFCTLDKTKNNVLNTKAKTSFVDLSSLVKKFDNKTFFKKKSKSVVSEHQKYGLFLARFLDDWEHKALYMRIAKETDRALVESALSYVADAKVDNKAKLFMWKLKNLLEKYNKPLFIKTSKTKKIKKLKLFKV